MAHQRLHPSQSTNGASSPRRWLTSRIGPVLVIMVGCVILLAAVGRAAEFVTAELDGTANNVTVEQGGSTTFTISVRATGTIRCSATPSTPATAQLHTSFAVGPSGTIAPSDLSAPLAFFGTGSGTCNVSWNGDPTPYRVSATVRADLYAPLGTRAIRLPSVLTTPGGSGSALRDDTATILTFEVVPGSDREPPAVECDGPRGTRGNGGWFVEPVAYDCTSVDAGSGLANAGDSSFTLETDGEGEVATGSRAIPDMAGNTATAGPYGPYAVDLHDPIVDVDEPAEGEAYVLGSSATPSYVCADTPNGSAIHACTATDLDTSGVGRKTFTVTAVDNAGRTTRVSRSYDVVYDVSPMTTPGTPREREPGAALVVRWQIEGRSNPSVVTGLASAEAPCGEPTVVTGATAVDGTPVRYDRGTEMFSFTWRTDKAWAGTCRQLQISLDDGTTRTLSVSFK